MNREEIILEIENAFKGVSLNNGIGIKEADAIDDYCSEQDVIKARKKDIRDDWKKIPDSVIGANYSALSFMDNDGLRFAIPAYMRFTLKYFDSSTSASTDSIINALGNSRNWSFLSKIQKTAISHFLEFMVLAGEDYIDSYQASLIYENTWSKF